MVDRNGLPLVIMITGANVHDSKQLLPLVDALPVLCVRQGVRHYPHKLHADKAYDSAALRQGLDDRFIIARIARRNVESEAGLGRHRWVVERTNAWINQFRRLKVRYERRADIHQAFLTLGCALICWRTLGQF